MLIEYGVLARLTGKPMYYDKAKRAVVALYQRQSDWAGGFRHQRGDRKWTDKTAGIMGGIDSYYEYLLKAAILFQIRTASECGALVWFPSTNIWRIRGRTACGMGRRT